MSGADGSGRLDLRGVLETSPTPPTVAEIPAQAAVEVGPQTPKIVPPGPRIEVLNRFSAGILIVFTALGIATFTILFFGIYLWNLDIRNLESVGNVVNSVFARTDGRTDGIEVAKFDAAIKIVTGQRNALPDTPTSEINELKVFVDELNTASFVTPAQAKKLIACSAPKSAQGMARPTVDQFDDCIQILETLRDVSRARFANVERLRVYREFVRDARDYHQSFRNFWLQLGQLILLNLLLPIITAVLGYIFGTQHGDRANP